MTARPELDLVGTWVRVLSIRSRLLAWYDRNRRDLPWRREPTAYRVLVSELMLQQTRVDVVVPYFERWMALFPTLEALAAAPLDAVLAAWSGLGYYRRARSLHEIARRVVAEHGGRVPEDPEVLRTLPGIGPYTAAAVASIAHGRAVAVVDGNVERVLSRLLGLLDEPGAERDRVVREAARRLVGGDRRNFATSGLEGPNPASAPAGSCEVAPVPLELRPGDWNQAVMELGAVVCLPAGPRCVECPIAKSCVANRAGLAAEIPRRKEKRESVDVTLRAALVRRGDEFLLVRRPEGSLLSGLWELPTALDGESVAKLAGRLETLVGRRVALPRTPARTFRHTITHRRITVHVHEATLPETVTVATVEGTAWVRRQDLRDFGVSSMTKKAVGTGETTKLPVPRGGARRQRRPEVS